jgi:hypothetical protein
LNQPDPELVEWARRLLAHEAAAVSADEPGPVAGRVFDKLHENLVPLLGAAGVDALFARSVMLVQARHAIFGEASVLGGAPRLRACLRAGDPDISTESAAALFGTFLALLTTLIGERLTAQALRSAWPTLEHGASRETRT